MFDVQAVRCSDRAGLNTISAAGLTPGTSGRILNHFVRRNSQPINPINSVIQSTQSTSLPDLTQKLQAAGLFSQMIANKFFQKIGAFRQTGSAKPYPGRFGQFAALNP